MELSGWDRKTSPYHAGEQTLHDRLGRKEIQDRMGRHIHRPYMPEEHREFFAQLPFLIAGSIDNEGWPWASILFGHPGFVSTPDDKTVKINASPLPGDPIATGLQSGSPLGFVGIELPTRRRNRVNGVVKQSDSSGFQVGVVQSYGNCPQYIHTRAMSFIRDPAESFSGETTSFTELTSEASTIIRQADTFFVASNNDKDDKHDTGGADVNHRGGKPGFIKVDGNTLTIPDFVGNFAFNTLGNFLINPRAGILFIDFSSGDIWQLTGTVELLWDKTKELEAFRGAERAWRFELHHGVCLRNAAPLRWENGVASANSLYTGDWDEAEGVLAAERSRKEWRSFRVARIEDEGTVIRSFYLESADAHGLLDYNPGQYLTIRLSSDTQSTAIRTYTLSSAPSDRFYRISVKREQNGYVSNHLHDTVNVGDLIEVMAPNGSFWLDTQERRPAVLIAGGVGITPMISMAHAAVQDQVRRRFLRPLTVFHAARSTRELAFAQEFTALEKATDGVLRYISLIDQPAPDETPGKEFDIAGRLSIQVLQRYLPLADYDFFLCGPPAFMQSVYEMLRTLGTRDERIFAESFGPASLIRSSDTTDHTESGDSLPAQSAVVSFKQSQLEQGWTPEEGTLLEFAEAHGLTPAFGCRSGACGACAVRVLSGKTSYKHEPSFQSESDEVLLCCAVPAQSEESLTLDL